MGVLATLRGPTLIRGGGRVSAAAMMLAAETQGLAIDFTDLSMQIKDTGTPANNFSGDPNSKLTYSAPSTKWILGSNGLYQSGTTLRTEYNSSSVALGVRIEEARTNVVLHNRDLTNAAWTKTNTTAAKDQTGIDGVANSASSLTATAGNGTCLQAITLGSSARYQSAFVKRITGSGTINMTMDNGTTWTAVTVTASWTRVEIPTQTLANPTVGFRIVTSGDAIAIDMVQNENGVFATSPIATAGSTVTRAGDDITIGSSLFPLSSSLGTMYVRSNLIAANANPRPLTLNDGTINECHIIDQTSTTATRGVTLDGLVTQASVSVTVNAGAYNKVAYAYALNDFSMVANAGTPQTDAAGTLPTVTRLDVGSLAGTSIWSGWISQIMYLPRRMSNADMQTLTT